MKQMHLWFSGAVTSYAHTPPFMQTSLQSRWLGRKDHPELAAIWLIGRDKMKTMDSNVLRIFRIISLNYIKHLLWTVNG